MIKVTLELPDDCVALVINSLLVDSTDPHGNAFLPFDCRPVDGLRIVRSADTTEDYKAYYPDGSEAKK